VPEDTTVGDGEPVGDTDEPLLKPSLTGFPWVRAAGASLATLVAQYLVLVTAVELTAISVTRPGWSLTDKAIQYVYVLYSAHHVPIATSIDQGIQAGTQLNNLLYGQSLFPVTLFFLLPIVALVVAGFLFERDRDPPESVGMVEEAAMVATGFTVPYVLAGAVGSFVFVRRISTESAQAASAPALLWAIVAMFLFPMVFVTVGASVASTTRSDERDTQS
jgi:hypothetical protein